MENAVSSPMAEEALEVVSPSALKEPFVISKPSKKVGGLKYVFEGERRR
jgi:hypothetical protein